jgi:hypothetical protein
MATASDQVSVQQVRKEGRNKEIKEGRKEEIEKKKGLKKGLQINQLSELFGLTRQ